MSKLFFPILSITLFLCFSLLFTFSYAHNKSQETSNNNNTHETQNENSPKHNNFNGCFHKVYAFGDLYTDTGNAEQLGGLQSKNGLYSGHLVVDFLCDALSLPHVPPFLKSSGNFTCGANFAIAGSTTLEKALCWIGSVGISDYARIQGSHLSARWLTQMSVAHVGRLLETLLHTGAKYIVVQGLPPIGCLPLHISLCPLRALNRMGCAAAVNTAVMIHNQILQRTLERFRKLYPNCHIVYADYWNAYLNILTNLKKYHFDEAFKPCCGAAGGPLNFNLHSLCGSPGTVTCKDPSKHISWDGIHLTEAMQQKVTDLFLNQGFCQPSFQEMVKSKSGI